MATTGSPYNIRYPIGSDHVDFALHFKNMAEDISGAIASTLEGSVPSSGGTMTGLLTTPYLTVLETFQSPGATLTGTLSGTSASFSETLTAAGTFEIGAAGPQIVVGSGAPTASKPQGTLYINKTSPNTQVYVASSGSGGWNQIPQANTNTYIANKVTYFDNNARLNGSSAFTFDGTTLTAPATTLTGDLTISKASPVLSVSATSGNSFINLNNVNSGWQSGLGFYVGNTPRWLLYSYGNETGSNAGSGLYIDRYSDAGSNLGTLMIIARSTGTLNYYGDLLLTKASPTITVAASSGNSSLSINTVSGSAGAVRFRTGSSQRWVIQKSGLSETGSNVGSNLEIIALDDSGNTLSTPLSITRSTGAVALTGDVTLSSTLSVDSTLDATSTTSASIQTDGGIAAAKKIMSSSVDTGQFNISKPLTGGAAQTYVAWTNPAGHWDHTIMHGSDSNLHFRRYDGNGTFLGTSMLIYRSTGNITLSGSLTVNGTGKVAYMTSPSNGQIPKWNGATGEMAASGMGATNGTLYYDGSRLDMFNSGPVMQSGTGSPEGVVTAKVGSIYFQTDSTVGVTHWRKASGTGNTGWEVMQGDTGERNVSASLINGQTGTLLLRRVNNIVTITVYQLTGTADAYTLPSGFGCRTGNVSILAMNSASATGALRISGGGNVRVYGAAISSGDVLIASYTTKDAWPTSLPGVAA